MNQVDQHIGVGHHDTDRNSVHIWRPSSDSSSDWGARPASSIRARNLPFGYGFGGLPEDLDRDEIIKAYLAAPLTLCLGTGDTLADEHLDLSPPAMAQGTNRLERGRACFERAHALAAERNWDCNWRLIEVAQVGHSAASMFAAEEVAQALFGPASMPLALADAHAAAH